jgi:hypothetical protein
MTPIPEHLREHGEALQPDDDASHAFKGIVAAACLSAPVWIGLWAVGRTLKFW